MSDVLKETVQEQEGGSSAEASQAEEAEAGEAEEASEAKGKGLSEEEKKLKKKEANTRYYQKVRSQLKQAAEPSPREEDPPKKAKPKKVAKSSPDDSPKIARTKSRFPPEPPESPRTRMIQAYREARLADQERKQARYRAWFE